MTPCINYHGYNMTLSDYNNSLNSIVNFKIYLSHKYKVLISEISWPIIVKYLQSLKEKKLLYIQPVKEVTAFSGKITLLKEYGFYLMQINNSLDIPESRKRFTIVHVFAIKEFGIAGRSALAHRLFEAIVVDAVARHYSVVALVLFKKDIILHYRLEVNA